MTRLLLPVTRFLQVGGDCGNQLRGLGLLLARVPCDRIHVLLPFFLLRDFVGFTASVSSASISSTVGRLPFNSLGSFSTSLVCQPEAVIAIFEVLQERNAVVPGQLCKSLLHNCSLRPGCRKCPHVLEVTRGESLHVGEGLGEIRSRPVDHLGAERK